MAFETVVTSKDMIEVKSDNGYVWFHLPSRRRSVHNEMQRYTTIRAISWTFVKVNGVFYGLLALGCDAAVFC